MVKFCPCFDIAIPFCGLHILQALSDDRAMILSVYE